jgi:hypothetical protein
MKAWSLAWFLLWVLACAVAAQVPKATPTAKKDQCSIAGMVVKLAESEPLRKARVRLQSVDDRTHSIGVTTDVGGRFELKGLDPGRYKLTASRVGFVTYEYGQRKPGDPGATLTLRPGQEMKDLVFRLIPSGVIAGRILDEDGEPLPSVSVSALREVYTEGKRNLSTSTTVETNDLGEYRLFGLPPGRYFISALYAHWNRFGEAAEPGESEASSQGYAKMYYPGTPDAGKASAIVLKAGDEIPSMEILMRQILVYRVRGRVYNQVTHKPGEGANVILIAKTTSHEWDFGDHQANVQKPDGSFEIREVLPGSYVLVAFWFDAGKIYTSRTQVEVGNADVEGLGVTIAAGTSIDGRVIWEGKPGLEKDELTVAPRPTDMDLTFGSGTRVNPDNSFTLKDVGDGTYNVDVGGQSKDCYIKDVQYAGFSVLDNGFTVARGSPALLEITISSHGARVQGTVVDQDGLPASGVWVVLVPDAAHQPQHRLYKEQTTDQYGHYDLRGVVPGDYKLFSWDEVEQGAWEDPDFLKPLEEKGLGEKMTIQEGEVKSVNLVAIKTASTEQQKP